MEVPDFPVKIGLKESQWNVATIANTLLLLHPNCAGKQDYCHVCDAWMLLCARLPWLLPCDHHCMLLCARLPWLLPCNHHCMCACDCCCICDSYCMVDYCCMLNCCCLCVIAISCVHVIAVIDAAASLIPVACSVFTMPLACWYNI